MPGVTIVQIAGSEIGTKDFSPELCTTNIAYRIGGRCVNLHAPGIVSRPDVKKLIMQESSLVEQFKLLRSCTKVLFGVANLSEASTALRSGYMTAEKIRPYVKRGAVAVMSGRFLDADGNDGARCARRADDRIDPGRDRRDTRNVSASRAASRRSRAIRAMLRGEYATILVTDEPTARALVNTGD